MGRIAKHLLAVSQNAAAKGKAIQGKNKAMKNVPDRDLGRAAVASLDRDRAVGALSGKDVYMLATFAKAYALRRSGRAYEALDELINVRALSRDSNLAALAAVEAGRTEILLGDYDRGFSRLQDGKTKAKKLRLADAISVFMGFIYLRDYDSPTVASGFFKEITTGKQQSSIGTFSSEILMPEMQRNPRVRTGTHGISISQRVFAEDFEDKGFEEGLGKVGSEVKVTRLADAAREGRAGAGVTGFGGPGGLTIERSFKCEETVISASIKLECDAERVILSVKADDGSIYRAHIHGLPKDTWRTILFPLPALTRKSGEGVITGKTVTQTVIAVTPVAKGPVKFSVDDIIIHNGADFSLDDE